MHELLRLLAHVPDVSLPVLGEPVVGSLDRPTPRGDRVPHHDAGHAHDELGLVRDGKGVDLRGGAVLLHASVAEGRAGRQREVGVIHAGDEIRGIDPRWRPP